MFPLKIGGRSRTARPRPKPRPRPKARAGGARRRQPLSAKDRRGIALFVGIFAVIAGFIALRIVLQDPREYDEASLCPTSGPVDHLAILVDKSEPLTPSQTVFVRQVLENEVGGLAIGERLSLFLLSDSDYDLAPLFSKCFPGDGSEANALYQNPALMRRRFDEAFAQPFAQAVGEAVQARQGKTSPIMEMIQQISVLPTFRDIDAGRRRLLIVSDMLHNMPYFTQYRPDGADFDKFMRTAGKLAPTVLLGEVDVRIVYLVRGGDEAYQGRDHLAFWERWIAEMGGHLVQVDRVR